MNVINELKRGNRMSVKLWLATADPNDLWQAYIDLASIQDVEMFRIAVQWVPSYESVFASNLSDALDKELGARAAEPEIGFELFVKLSEYGLHTSSTSTSIRLSAGVGYSYSGGHGKHTITSFSTRKLFQYLTDSWPDPCVMELFKMVCFTMLRVHYFKLGWENDLRRCGLLGDWGDIEDQWKTDSGWERLGYGR